MGPAHGTSHPEEVTVRTLGRDEGQRLREFYNGLCQNSLRLFRPLGCEASLEQCHQIAADASGERYDLVTVVGDRLVGWAFLCRMNEDIPHLGIGLADDHLGKGLGTLLMQGLVDEARRRGKKGIDLIVVQDNDRAIRLYERFGFRVTGTRKGDDGLDYFEMLATF